MCACVFMCMHAHVHLCVYVIRDVYCTDVWGFFVFYDTLQPNYLLVYGHTALSFFSFFSSVQVISNWEMHLIM